MFPFKLADNLLISEIGSDNPKFKHLGDLHKIIIFFVKQRIAVLFSQLLTSF